MANEMEHREDSLLHEPLFAVPLPPSADLLCVDCTLTTPYYHFADPSKLDNVAPPLSAEVFNFAWQSHIRADLETRHAGSCSSSLPVRLFSF